MAIIDRYLLRQYVQNFLICFLSLIGLYIVFESSTNMNEFIRCGTKQGSVLGFMMEYYAYKSILFFDDTAGMLAMVAAMFTVSWIQRYNEMTALLAAGVPRYRILRPILIAAIVVILFAAVNRELVLPQCRNEMSRNPQNLIGDREQPFDLCYDNETGVCLSGAKTFANNKSIIKPDFRMPVLLRDYGKQFTAEKAFYHAPEGGHPGGYLLDNVTEPKSLEARPSLCLNGRPVLITPHDAPDWLKPNQCFLVSNLEFEQVSGTGTERAKLRKLSSTRQLILGLRNPSQEFGADVRVDIHSRIVRPLLDITLLFLGLPLVIAKESRNVFVAMGLCMVLTTTFTAVVLGMQFLGSNSLIIGGPAFAAWCPLIIFVPIATGMSDPLWN
jgi:lipopolysaccharide export system permease protein